MIRKRRGEMYGISGPKRPGSLSDETRVLVPLLVAMTECLTEAAKGEGLL